MYNHTWPYPNFPLKNQQLGIALEKNTGQDMRFPFPNYHMCVCLNIEYNQKGHQTIGPIVVNH